MVSHIPLSTTTLSPSCQFIPAHRSCDPLTRNGSELLFLGCAVSVSIRHSYFAKVRAVDMGRLGLFTELVSQKKRAGGYKIAPSVSMCVLLILLQRSMRVQDIPVLQSKDSF